MLFSEEIIVLGVWIAPLSVVLWSNNSGPTKKKTILH